MVIELPQFKNPEYPSFHAPVFRTDKGTPYLREPGVVLVSKPQTNLIQTVDEFLGGFDEELGFRDYIEDAVAKIPDGTKLAKFAGQLCYMSFGEKRTKSTPEGLAKYFDNIKSSGHGSVLEHANYSFLIYGASRSFTHELVRHRAGIGYSQLSQRYVDGKVLRFVERLEYQNDSFLHNRFVQNCDRWAEEYEAMAWYLAENQIKNDMLGIQGMSKTDLRKRVNQVAREDLPNATEAPIVATGNARTWRHIIEMRTSKHAEVQIRRAGMKLYWCLLQVVPELFSDYQIEELRDGTLSLTTAYRKV